MSVPSIKYANKIPFTPEEIIELKASKPDENIFVYGSEETRAKNGTDTFYYNLGCVDKNGKMRPIRLKFSDQISIYSVSEFKQLDKKKAALANQSVADLSITFKKISNDLLTKTRYKPETYAHYISKNDTFIRAVDIMDADLRSLITIFSGETGYSRQLTSTFCKRDKVDNSDNKKGKKPRVPLEEPLYKVTLPMDKKTGIVHKIYGDNPVPVKYIVDHVKARQSPDNHFMTTPDGDELTKDNIHLAITKYSNIKGTFGIRSIVVSTVAISAKAEAELIIVTRHPIVQSLLADFTAEELGDPTDFGDDDSYTSKPTNNTASNTAVTPAKKASAKVSALVSAVDALQIAEPDLNDDEDPVDPLDLDDTAGDDSAPPPPVVKAKKPAKAVDSGVADATSATEDTSTATPATAGTTTPATTGTKVTVKGKKRPADTA